MKTGTTVPGNERVSWKGRFLTAISVCVICDSMVMQRLSLMDSMVAGLEISNSMDQGFSILLLLIGTPNYISEDMLPCGLCLSTSRF